MMTSLFFLLIKQPFVGSCVNRIARLCTDICISFDSSGVKPPAEERERLRIGELSTNRNEDAYSRRERGETMIQTFELV